jgi:hypothetical protein
MGNRNDFKISYRVLFPDNRIKQIIEIGQPYKNEKGKHWNARNDSGCNKGKRSGVKL